MAYYFDSNPESKSDEKLIKCEINNNIYPFYTDNNVFSKKYLDFGTRTLLESINLSEIKGDILDFGCGYGPIGIYIKKNCECNVDMVDVNIFLSDIYSNVLKKYDFIITNPPIRVGKEILYKILFDAKEHLKKNGKLYLVINKDQGAKSLKKDLEECYKVTTIKKNKGFYVFECQIH